jgi:hypothetical protein
MRHSLYAFLKNAKFHYKLPGREVKRLFRKGGVEWALGINNLRASPSVL